MEAWGATIGRFAFGALFAVDNSKPSLFPQSVLPKMKKLAADFQVNGYVYERLWLHIFGLPFGATVEPNPLEAKRKLILNV